MPTLPSSLQQLSLCARELDELLEFPEPHKGRGSHPGTVGSWGLSEKGLSGEGRKGPTDQSVISSGRQYTIFL